MPQIRTGNMPLRCEFPQVALVRQIASMKTSPEFWPCIDTPCANALNDGGLRPLTLCERTLLPIVQGGMGIGVSAHRLAGSVAALGGVGTISSVDLRRHHPDLMGRTSGLPPGDATRQVIDAANLEAIEREVPLIAAGGIRSHADIVRLQGLGAAGVQLGTPFAVTEEGDAHPEFKRVLAQSDDDDMVEFTSVAGLPARAVDTPWLRAYLKLEDKLQAVSHAKSRCTKNFDCLAQCGLRDGLKGWGQFCIDNQLAAALRGDVKKGLFFRGVGALPFGDQIRSVRALIDRLLVPLPVGSAAIC